MFSPLVFGRIKIREFCRKDNQAVLKACQTSPAIDTMHSHQLKNLGAVNRYLGCLIREYGYGRYCTLAVADRETDGLLGMISLETHPAFPRGELGYWVIPSRQGEGIATQAVKAMIRYGMEQKKLLRIQAIHLPDNPASGRVLQKAGMTYEGTLRRYLMIDGKPADCLVYAVIKDEKTEL